MNSLMSNLKIIFISTLLACACLYADDSDSSIELIRLTPEQIAHSQIEMRHSSSVILRQTFSVPAKITVNELRQAVIVAKAPGIVTKVNKNIGDPVEVDESLAVLESKEMAEAKAAYITALKREALAAQTLKAEEALKEKKISSEQDYLRTVLAAEEAHINLEVAEQHLNLLGMNTNDVKQLKQEGLSGLCCYQIKSPVKGAIIEKNITIGSLVSSEQEVYKIADLDTVWVELGIYSNNLYNIKPGHKIFLSPLKDDHPTAQAEITYISPIIDEHTRTATAIALLSNTTRDWYPGAFVRAEVVSEEAPVPIAVLKEAIQEIDEKNFLFIQHPEGFEKREVKIGRSDSNYVEILSGIELNTPYAAINTFLLKAEDGKKDAEL